MLTLFHLLPPAAPELEPEAYEPAEATPAGSASSGLDTSDPLIPASSPPSELGGDAPNPVAAAHKSSGDTMQAVLDATPGQVEYRRHEAEAAEQRQVEAREQAADEAAASSSAAVAATMASKPLSPKRLTV